MASLLLLRRNLLPTLGATAILLSPHNRNLIACDSARARAPTPTSTYAHTRPARNPLLAHRPHPATVRQITSGSMLGLCAGLAVSVFSKPLALILGLLLAGAFALESRGVRVVPYAWIERKVRGIGGEDVRGAVLDNVAFKIAFGSAFALAGFGALE